MKNALLYICVGFVLGLAVAPCLWDELGNQDPAITGFSPASGPPGTHVIVRGRNFLNVGAVAFSGVATTAYIVNSATQLTVTVPAGANSGLIGIAARGGEVASTDMFLVTPSTPAPTITNIFPACAPVGAGVTITGTNFVTVNAVAFNGLAATQYTVNSPTQITAIVPAGATTGPIGVAAVGGVVGSTMTFTVTPSASSPVEW